MHFFNLYAGVILLSANGLFSKTIPLDAISTTQLRSLIAVAALFLFLKVFQRPLAIKGAKNQLGVYFLGVLMGSHWVSYFYSMQISTVAIGMLSLFTFPVITVFMEAVIHRERPKWQDLISGAFILLGVWVMSGGGVDYYQSDVIQGILWGVVSAVLFSARNIIQKYYYADTPSENLMYYQVIVISIGLLFFIDFEHVVQLTSTSWLQLIGLGVFTTAAAHTLLVSGYKSMSAKTAAMISCLQPVIGSLLAWLVLGESLTVAIAIGGAIILAVAIYESVSHIRH